MTDALNAISGASTSNVNIQPFTSPGGVTPPQTALANFTRGQGDLAQRNMFGSSGTGQSSMATQGAGGVNFGAAEMAGQMSDINQEAMYNLYQNDVQSELQQLANTYANSQANNQAFASSFGTSLGSFGSGTQTG